MHACEISPKFKHALRFSRCQYDSTEIASKDRFISKGWRILHIPFHKRSTHMQTNKAQKLDMIRFFTKYNTWIQSHFSLPSTYCDRIYLFKNCILWAHHVEIVYGFESPRNATSADHYAVQLMRLRSRGALHMQPFPEWIVRGTNPDVPVRTKVALAAFRVCLLGACCHIGRLNHCLTRMGSCTDDLVEKHQRHSMQPNHPWLVKTEAARSSPHRARLHQTGCSYFRGTLGAYH